MKDKRILATKLRNGSSGVDIQIGQKLSVFCDI